MNDDRLNGSRLTDRMQEVLEGTASRADTVALHALLARDADAAREFAAWTAMFDGLSSLPMAHPPEGLVAAIDATVSRAIVDGDARGTDASEKIFADTFQLFPEEPVIGSGFTQTRRPFGFKSISSWLMPATSRESHNMNTQQKFLAGGAAVVVALGLVAVLSNFPPASTEVLGTVVPAERYRAPQSGAEAVKLGEQNTVNAITTGADTVGVAAANAQAAAQADRNVSQLNAADRNAAQLNSADRNVSQLNAADRNVSQLNSADRNVSQLNAADRNVSQLNAADRNVSQLNSADRNVSQLNAADRNVSQLNSADRNVSQLNAADRNVSQLNSADRNVSQLNAADRNVSQLNAADRNAAQLNAADRNAAQRNADRNAAQLNAADRNAAQLNAADRNAK